MNRDWMRWTGESVLFFTGGITIFVLLFYGLVVLVDYLNSLHLTYTAPYPVFVMVLLVMSVPTLIGLMLVVLGSVDEEGESDD